MISIITQAFRKVPPLWELERFVAVNPFLGWTHKPFSEALSELETVWQRPLLPDQNGHPLQIKQPHWQENTAASLLGAFLASYFDQGQAIWPAPWKNQPLFAAWCSSLPASTGLVGTNAKKLKERIKTLPQDLPSVWAQLIQESDRSESQWYLYLRSLLTELPGWAAFLRRKSWPEDPGIESELSALAAMLVILEQIVEFKVVWPKVKVPLFQERMKWLTIRESTVIADLGKIVEQTPASVPAPAVRAAFCIDVRSEVFRRAWEAQSADVLTDGFAGFFGLPLAWHGSQEPENLLPVLLSPGIHLSPSQRPILPDQKLKSDLVGGPQGLAFVEVGGALSLISRLKGNKSQCNRDSYEGLEAAARALPAEQKINLAAGILKNLGWQAPWAPLMIFIGHGSTSANNPHAAGLDCGACGGLSGEANARMAAALCNDPVVREGLRPLGWDIPNSVLFLGGLHNTTLDNVKLFKSEADQAWKANIAKLESQLQLAGSAARAERIKHFPFLKRSAVVRSQDWAETRPETALAGNTCFIAAPRSFTRNLNLAGKAFLHSYQADLDKDGSVLELILTAPVVVASWINLQYFASTSAPEVYAAGDKVLHTIVGGVGVFEGNHLDLKPGLASQSVAFDEKPYHPSLRLHVLIQAAQENIERVLSKHAQVKALVENGWIHLFSFEAGSSLTQRTINGWKVIA
jgi:uncharacterized protein